MRSICVTTLTLILAFAVATEASAQVKVTWKKGYPQPGVNAGDIAIQGTYQAQNGWTAKSALAVAWPTGTNGGYQSPQTLLEPQNGVFSGVINNLNSGTSYWVIVQVSFQQNGTTNTKIAAGPPGTSKAK